MGPSLERGRDFNPERVRRPKIDDQFKCSRLHHRKLRGFGALKDSSGVNAGLTVRSAAFSASEWRGQDGQDEEKQCEHRPLTLGDSVS